jgi:dihydrofolate reductase
MNLIRPSKPLLLSKKAVKLYHVVAVAKNGVIGKNNQLPWHFSADLKHFKKLTMGGTILMGRKTFESIGRPLPGRQNFVLSRDKALKREGVCFFSSIDEAIESISTEKAFVIGGAELYKQTVDQVDGIYLTEVKSAFDGDTYYPEIPAKFKERSREESDEPQIEFVYLGKE